MTSYPTASRTFLTSSFLHFRLLQTCSSPPPFNVLRFSFSHNNLASSLSFLVVPHRHGKDNRSWRYERRLSAGPSSRSSCQMRFTGMDYLASKSRRRNAALEHCYVMVIVVKIVSRSSSLLGSPGHTALKQKDRAAEMLRSRSLRPWGVASALLATFILFPTMHSLSYAEAIRSAQYGTIAQGSHPGFPALPAFREAPWFHNGEGCVYTSNVTESEFICDPASVHIAMTLDSAYSRGSIAAVLSILQHASCPENIVFHFLVSDGEYEFQSLILSTFPHLKRKIYHFNENLVKDRISSSVRQALEQPLNYARNYLADILEACVQRVLYLDSDLVVVDDIAKLWGTSLGSKALGAPEYCHANFTKYFTSSFWSDRTLASTFAGRFSCYFNTGVMIMDLVKWRQNKYTREIERWMDIQKERRIYELGSLPPFLLVFAGLVEPVSHRWNQHGLGGDNVKGSCRPLHPGPVSLLHWSGTGKPWLRLDSNQPCPLDSLWAPYDLYVPKFHSER